MVFHQTFCVKDDVSMEYRRIQESRRKNNSIKREDCIEIFLRTY